MRKVLVVSALALCAGLMGCDFKAGYYKETVRTDLRHELEYAKDSCEQDPMVGFKSGLALAVEAKRDELKSASASLTAERYTALSQTLEQYTAKAQILHQEGYDRCIVYYQCYYGARQAGQGAATCKAEDTDRKATADAVRKALENIEQLKAK